MLKVKKFVQDHKPEIAIGVGVVATCAAAYLYHKHVVAGKQIHIVAAYKNNQNDGLKLVIQYLDKTQDIIDILPDTNK